MAKKVRQLRKYTKEFRQETVNLALKSPSISKVANDLGIPIATLHSWIAQLKNSSKSNDIDKKQFS